MKAQTCNQFDQCLATALPALNPLLDVHLFKALSDPTRIQILVHLAGCCEPQTVSQVAQCCSVDLSVVSRHLAVLRHAGILVAEKKSRFVLYSVRYSELSIALRSLADAIDACCPNGIASCSCGGGTDD